MLCWILLGLTVVLGIIATFCIAPIAEDMNRNIWEDQKTFLITVIPRWFFNFYITFLILLTSLSASKHFEFFQILIELQCSDSFTNTQSKLFGDNLTKYLVSTNLWVAFILVLVVVAEVGWGVYMFRKFKQQNTPAFGGMI